MDIEELIEDLRGLLKQYGEKIPYGELVGAPWPYSRSGDLVWQDPEPYFIEQAATALSTLQAENEKLRETVDKYATAARAIALHLKPFCDESFPYDEMIADAARKASDELEQVKQDRDAAVKDIELIVRRINDCNIKLDDGTTVSSLELGRCRVCKHEETGDCDDGECIFEWRGPKKEN